MKLSRSGPWSSFCWLSVEMLVALPMCWLWLGMSFWCITDVRHHFDPRPITFDTC